MVTCNECFLQLGSRVRPRCFLCTLVTWPAGWVLAYGLTENVDILGAALPNCPLPSVTLLTAGDAAGDADAGLTSS